MYIEKVPNRNSPPAVLLRESYRENGKVKKRTLANLSNLPEDVIDNMKLAFGSNSFERGGISTLGQKGHLGHRPILSESYKAYN
jgi:hypothetical protein